jgi:hypothetical protein
MTWAHEGGALHLPRLFSDNLDFWLRLCSPYFERQQAGVRVTDDGALAQALRSMLSSEPMSEALGKGQWKCVRAVAFDKNPETNWSLGWHQDRTIAVKQRVDVQGFGPWSTKQGIQHVEPPFARIEAMRTLRMHFDPVDENNGPLLVALGSQSKNARWPPLQINCRNCLATPRRVMVGFMRPQSCTLLDDQSAKHGGAYFSSTFHPIPCQADLNGSASVEVNPPQPARSLPPPRPASPPAAHTRDRGGRAGGPGFRPRPQGRRSPGSSMRAGP